MELLLIHYYFPNLLLEENEFLNDLWQYNTSSGIWCWIGGSKLPYEMGTYGPRGESSEFAAPGSRHESFYWKDSIGNFYLYGGLGMGIKGKIFFISTLFIASVGGVLSDMWMFNPETLQWTWMSGAYAPNVAVYYGTEELPGEDLLK